MASKKRKYLYKLIQDPVSFYWHGECWINDKLWKATLKMVNQKVAINRLNKIIDSYNLQHSGAVKTSTVIPNFDLEKTSPYQVILPAIPDDKWRTATPKPKNTRELPVIPMRKEEPTQTKEATMNTESPQEIQTVTIKTQRKKVTPRKPFTPYGLNGYLVDKNGKVRLMLDRKANAQTITLEPEMFAMLADMVKATQAQERNNELPTNRTNL
ncbi:hypothetical protein [Avibacterium paragallinarum]|uniref:hypothetical protein n=1 Tax=Avibacterium paragallinarum TaxID=728 RepID=UPI003AEFAFC6